MSEIINFEWNDVIVHMKSTLIDINNVITKKKKLDILFDDQYLAPHNHKYDNKSKSHKQVSRTNAQSLQNEGVYRN